jgi:hypothetical protein
VRWRQESQWQTLADKGSWEVRQEIVKSLARQRQRMLSVVIGSLEEEGDILVVGMGWLQEKLLVVMRAMWTQVS